MSQYLKLILSACLISFTTTTHHESCDKRALRQCSQSLEELFSSQFSQVHKTKEELSAFCSDLKGKVSCLTEKTELCKEEVPGVIMAEEVISGYIYSLCNSNSKKKALFMSQSECLTSIEGKLQECSPIVATEGQSEEEIEQKVCSEHSVMVNCLVNKSEQFCLKDGKKVMKMMLDPWNHFMAMQCEEDGNVVGSPGFRDGNETCDDGDIEECLHFGLVEMIPPYLKIKDSAEELDIYCQKVKRKSACFSMNTKGCTKELITDFERQADVVKHFGKSFCDSGTTRQKYLTKAECLSEAEQEIAKCHNIEKPETITEDNMGEVMCRKYAELFDCASAKSKKMCGTEGKEVMDEVLSIWRRNLHEECNGANAMYSSGLMSLIIAVIVSILLMKNE